MTDNNVEHIHETTGDSGMGFFRSLFSISDYRY